MTLVVRLSVSLLLLCALLKISHASCDGKICADNETETLTADTTTVTFGSEPNCNLSIGNQSSGQGSITGLTSGAVYSIFFSCLNCCKEVTTKPETVSSLQVTDITTSSMFLKWTKPNGNSPIYRVHWTDGKDNKSVDVTETSKKITNLTAGVQYHVSVSAVADDKMTEGEKATVSNYTKPEVVRNLAVMSVTTSSMFVNWTEPEGESSVYRVQWKSNSGKMNKSSDVTETHINITNLTAGVQYEISVTAMVKDGSAEGESATVSQYTKPEVVRDLSVVTATTSSISLNWTEPEGSISHYRVQWTNGTTNGRERVTETKINVTELTAGVQYSFTVIAVAGDNTTESAVAEISHYTKPEVVRNLAVMSVTTSSMFVNWTEPEGESSVYRVQWKTNSGKMNKSSDVTKTHINITNLTAGVQYEISVTAMVKDGSAEGESATVSQYTKPEVVRNLSVVTATTSSISLNWTEPEGSISHYRVQWTNGTTNGNERVTETKINVTELTAGVQYSFTVIAVAGDNTTESAVAEISHYTKPEVVRNLAVISVTTSSMFVNWTEPEGESSVYRVQWKSNSGKMNKSSDVTETHINITNLTAGVQYEISVTAMVKDGSAEGESATVSQYTKPEIVRDLSVVTATTSSISLNWTEPEGSISHYRVQWTNGTTHGNERVTETKINVTELTAGVQYSFTVIAVAGDNTTESAVAEISHYTKPKVVRNLTVSGVTTSSMFVNWTEPEGKSSSYRVEWTNGKIMETVNVTQTHINITNLIAGVQYEISVSAVANDGSAEGESVTVSQYTKPDKIWSHNAFPNSSSIYLNWTAPPGNVVGYKINWHNGGTGMVNYTQATSIVLSDLSPGTSYTIQIRAVNGAGDTGEPYTFTSDTKPAVVKDLIIDEVTASSVSLTWTKPEGNATSYIVRWTQGGKSDEKTTTDTSINITGLSPGFQYDITVSAVSGDPKNEGEGNSKTTSTKPVEPIIGLKLRKTDSLNIAWTLTEGRVDHYVVSISNEELKFSNHIMTTETSFYFTGLKPGRVYVITVTAVAGNFSKTSEAPFATDPVPPGPIVISSRTNSSLHIQWEVPAEMSDAPNISYMITFSSTDGHTVQKTKTTVNQTELSPLSSGTLYNISVQIVGPEDLKSSAVYESAYTMPNPVLNLVSRPKSTTSVEVKWSEPDGVQAYYKYSVKAVSSTGKVVDLKVNSTSTNITDLEPGTRYNISVRTIAAPGTESADENTFSYTLPKAVTNLTVTATPTTVELSWQKQSDHKPSYSYRVQAYQDNKLVQNNSTNTEKFTFSSLCPGGFYTFKVNTVVGDVMSADTSKTTNTKPAAVRIISFLGTTTNFTVSWTAAGCHVDSYSVRLHRNGELVKNSTELSNTTFTKLFVDLKPGVLYCAEVVSKSGLFENTSPSVCNATFPNPPGPIMVEFQTEVTINFTWSLPEDMNHRMYNFSVSSSQGSVLTENSWFLLENLESGTLYSFSVVTVGVMNYESTAVTAQKYTRPYPVTLLKERTQITTSNVTLFWFQRESKPHYSYVVQASNSNQPELVTDTTTMIGGLLSGSKYSFTVTAQTADGTQAAPVTVSYFTRPYGIRGLNAYAINTTDVHLSWTEPLEYKPEYTYRVETTGCDSLINQTRSENSTQISELTPGTKCTFCVTVRAADHTEGEGNCISQYTKPETVQPSISSSGSNSSVLVQWARPAGRVERYKVHLKSTTGADKEEELSSTSTSFLFDGLSAGMIYSAMVTTISGPFNETSVHVANATFPNPPGQIEVLKKTTSSIHIKWDEAPLMTGASFFYRLSNISSQRGDYVSAKNTSHTFTALLSGTAYNISVATVGAMGFQSERVQINMVNTRPFSVTSLHVSETEEEITVTWNQPDQYKESYRFNLTRQSSDELRSFISKDNTFSFDGLTPGSRYNISVTTQTADETQGDPKQTSTCTKASPVTNFTCEGPKKTNAKLVLTWNCPHGLYSGFQISVNNGMTINPEYPHCHHTVTGLSHYTQYNLTVRTQSCGLPSRPISRLCKTGITDPPVPEDDKSLVRVQEILHDRFSLQINSSLLNSTNGPIRHVGVLVTDKNLDTSVFRKYLGETYDDWKAKKTPVYLATVRDINPESRSGVSQVSIEVGDESVWNGYSNGVLQANKNYKVAVVIFTDLNLQNNLVNGEQSLVSVLLYSVDIHLPADPAVVGLAVGATLGIFCILFIILIGFIVYWRRLSIKESPDIQIYPVRSKSAAVRVEDFEAHYKKQKADSNCGFAEEFEDLKVVGTGQSKTNALTLENKPKNRYNNVLPYDSSRVKLSIIHGNPHDDYINANYMPGYNSKKEFIAAQGPLPHTVKEFWRMIWEKNVQTLVMLTRCNEQGRVKCEQYWAPGTKHFENIIVTTTSEIPLKDWTIRDFDVKNVKTAETRSVRHFHFTAWPDHGVPETTELLISFRHLVREHMDQYSKNSPTVVHCSAGVGRTGTFIAIDRLIIQIERENTVDVYGIVHDLRMNRPLMVQTEDQYVFLNQCAIDIIRSRTGNNVDLIYQNTAALSIYENLEPIKGFSRNGY